MKSIGVVKRDVALQRITNCQVLFESDPVVNLRLHRMEEGFDEGVVGHLAWPVHALRDPELPEASLERRCGVFGAAVGMEHQTRFGATPAYGAVECTQRQSDVF